MFSLKDTHSISLYAYITYLHWLVQIPSIFPEYTIFFHDNSPEVNQLEESGTI